MRKIAVIDAETDPFRKGRIPMPFAWGFFDGKRYRQFASTASLVRFLKKQNCICYAHNGGKFDFHYLLAALAPYDDIMIINGRIAKMHLGLCELRDSVCILPVALSAYKKDEIDYGIFESGEREKAVNKQRIAAYLESDCRYLYQMVMGFIGRFGDSLTVAGAAMKQWQKISKREEIAPADQTDKEFYETFAPYYYGGRVECLRAGVIDVDFAVYDINSSYAFAMLQMHPYCANFERIEGYVQYADFYKLRCVSRGAFPFRGNTGNVGMGSGLSFPRDNVLREYTVTRWEYDAAIETNTIRRVKVVESIRFTRRQSFTHYVLQFYEERARAKADGDTLGEIFAKLMGNALYGKWASNPDNYRNYINVPVDKAYLLASPKSAFQFAGELGPWILGAKVLDPQAARYYNVATGASITGLARANLWRAMCTSKGVLYVDTDSIACEQRGREIVLGSDLGQWKHEGDFDRAGIAGKKLYIFRGIDGKVKTASKGVRLTNAQLWEVAAGGAVEYESETPSFSIHKAPGFVKRNIVTTAGG